ncbi:terminus macrodomain insulation protein YfbV [Paraferrimonas sedimenticola]|uniref:UPF0208 membrane protein YfbV n=1 Tax=Paraferrimonas sedimenticola TaxID=375674 RepID=A0AA37VSC1_9GAMM|nr:terminus macrodomain insulation protein YfbV [Paraferrimonas sedimenticola]GLP94809.1 UPF0208 membrane protein [Paraferrimonas sedimenticola]
MNAFSSLFSEGQRYMATWPMLKALASSFPEYRVIKATQFAMRYLPAVAVLVAFGHVSVFGLEQLPQALAMALLILSLPMQGLLWLGWRARHPLPLSVYAWCQQLQQRMREAGHEAPAFRYGACYLDLACILNQALVCLDDNFLDDL